MRQSLGRNLRLCQNYRSLLLMISTQDDNIDSEWPYAESHMSHGTVIRELLEMFSFVFLNLQRFRLASTGGVVKQTLLSKTKTFARIWILFWSLFFQYMLVFYMIGFNMCLSKLDIVIHCELCWLSLICKPGYLELFSPLNCVSRPRYPCSPSSSLAFWYIVQTVLFVNIK